MHAALQASTVLLGITFFATFWADQQSPAALRRLPAEPDIEGRIRTQLEDLGRICPGRPRYTSCDGADRANWTWAVLTRICCHTAPGLGQWHTFRLLTHLRSGQRVGAGGDTWNVRLEDPASGSLLRARVLDDGDGGYTVAFVPLQPGTYQVRAWLYYSRCLGYQDMPPALDVHYSTVVSDADWCFIGQEVALPPITVAGPPGQALATVPAAPPPPPAHADLGTLRAQQHVFGGGLGRPPHLRPMSGEQRAAWQTTVGSSGRVVLVGDSTVEQAALLLAAGQRGCRLETAPKQFWAEPGDTSEGGVHRRCGNYTRGGQPGFFNLTLAAPFGGCRQAGGRRGVAVSATPEKVFRDAGFAPAANTSSGLVPAAGGAAGPAGAAAPLVVHYALNYECQEFVAGLRDVLRELAAEDVLFVNMGLHCVYGATWPQYTAAVAEVAAALAAAPTRAVFWRSTVAVQEHEPWAWRGVEALAYPGGFYHFTSEPRRLLMNLHAEQVMRGAGIRVLDVEALPVEYQDVMHFDLAGFDVHNRLLDWSVC